MSGGEGGRHVGVRRWEGVGRRGDGMDRTAPSTWAGLDEREGLDFCVRGEGGGRWVMGQLVLFRLVGRRGSVFEPRVRVRRRRQQHHAVELADVGSEAVDHAADLVHDGMLGRPHLLLQRAAADGATAAAAAPAADAVGVL